MHKKELLFLVLFTSFVTCIFFAKTIFLRQIPFPGDLLIDTTPFKTQSYLGYAPGGYPNKAQGRDVITQSYPWKLFSVAQLKNGQLPLWNPYNFSGNPHIANYQTGIFYPLNILFLLLPYSIAWSLFIILQPILALTFMYLFLRSLKLQVLPSLLGGVAFGFSSYMIMWLEYGNIDHALLWLPIMLFTLRKYILTRKFGFAVLFILAGIFCLLAGYIQGAFYVFLVTALYGGFFLLRQKERKLWFIVPGFFLIAIAVSAVQVAPTIVLFLHSTRGGYTQAQIHNLLNPWYYLITLFASEFFGNPATRNFYLPITYFERVLYPGIPVLFFALYALQKVKRFEIKFFGILALIVLIITTNLPGISWLYALPIPVLSTTVPTRFLSIFIFCVSVLGVFGIDYWITKKDIKSIVPFIFGGVYIVIGISIVIASKLYPSFASNIAITRHTFILSTGIALGTIGTFFLRKRLLKVSLFLLTVLIIFDLFYVFAKFTPFSPVSLIFPQTQVVKYLKQRQGIYRTWGYGSAYIPANYATAFGLYQPDGYDALHNKDYNLLLNSSAVGKVTLPISRGDANIAPGTGFVRLPDNIYRQKILNLVGVKYIMHIPFSGDVGKAETGVFPESDYRMVWHDRSYQIYENLHVFPRFFLANTYKQVNSKNDISEIYSVDLRKTVLLYREPQFPLDASGSGTVELNTYTPNLIRLTTNTSGNKLLFLSDTYDSGWHVTIDGQATDLYKADVAFRAVEVSRGKHIIVFSYQPQAFDIGLGITLISIIVGVSYLLVRRFF